MNPRNGLHRNGRGLPGHAVSGIASLVVSAGATLALVLGLLAACAPAPVQTVLPTAAAASPAAPTGDPGQTCDDATQTYDPLPSLPRPEQIPDAATRAIVDRGYLIVGVSADTRLLGSRNPLTGRIEGFDIDLARAVAQALLGDPDKVKLRVISAADRLPALQAKEVDLVARALTMTCQRWQQIAFSAEYYQAGQRVLVRADPDGAIPTAALGDLASQRVCAPAGTSSYNRMATVPGVVPVAADSHTACLVLFQQGRVDAITGDDTVLAGLASQDPYAVITSAPPIASEPYGLGLNAADVYLARYVNRVLADRVADGGWGASYDRWLAPTLGPAGPPVPRYGR